MTSCGFCELICRYSVEIDMFQDLCEWLPPTDMNTIKFTKNDEVSSNYSHTHTINLSKLHFMLYLAVLYVAIHFTLLCYFNILAVE